MSFNQFRARVEGDLASKFGQDYPDIPVNFPNTPYIDGTTGRVASLAYVDEDSFTASIGGRKVKRFPGIIQIDIIVTVDTGAGEAVEIAEKVASIFDSEEISIAPDHDVTFKVPQIKQLGVQGESFRVAARIPYLRDTYTNA